VIITRTVKTLLSLAVLIICCIVGGGVETAVSSAQESPFAAGQLPLGVLPMDLVDAKNPLMR
jgi:hypothetical protein